MALTSLLVCVDAEAVQVLSRVLQDLGIEVEISGDPLKAKVRLAERPFAALVVDCQHETAAADLVVHSRRASTHRPAVVIAMVSGPNQARDILDKGVSFVLYKPISPERVAHSIRAARSLIRQERRIQPRAPVYSQVSITYADQEDVPAALVELNENGLCIQTEGQLPPGGKIYFKFALPGDGSIIRLAGEVMWQDASGRVGIRFLQLPHTSKRNLQRWLETNLSPASEIGGSGYGGSPSEDLNQRLSAGLGLLSASAADRRKLVRHACRLGAEVYRTGSTVPHRCRLSDISMGGCYLESTETFLTGTSLEIVVRTPDLKMSIVGTVQSAHPAFGMGVTFTSKSEDQKKEVQKLIAYAESEPQVTG